MYRQVTFLHAYGIVTKTLESVH